MKKILITVLLVIAAASPAFARRKKTAAEERVRFETLLGYIKTSDVPSRVSSTREMIAFDQWIDRELLGRLNEATLRERQIFWVVLYERGCRAALDPAYQMLPEAIERCRSAQIVVYEVARIWKRAKKAKHEGNTAEADRLTEEANTKRREIPFNEITQGDEVAILCAIMSRWGRERELKRFVQIAMDSSTDDALARGIRQPRTRTHRDKTLPGGTVMWNPVYTPVWEGLAKFARRPFKVEILNAQRTRLDEHFEELEKNAPLGPNQKAAVLHYQKIRDAMDKTREKRPGVRVDDKEDDKKDDTDEEDEEEPLILELE